MSAIEAADRDVFGENRERQIVQALVENHRRFLAFVKARVGDSALAEDILQAAFVKTAEDVASIRDEDTAVAWFYRLLRNAVIDLHRKRGAEARALERFAHELPESVDALPDVKSTLCACVLPLVAELSPEYRDVLERVDLRGEAIASVAADGNITENNARVRLHRARQALRRSVTRACGTCAAHGCLDCSCGSKSAEGTKTE